MTKELVGVVWWPHSGGRWFCRSLMKKNTSVHETAFTHPWIFFTTDMTLELDITAQVHKARSLPELRNHLEALKQSTDHGRVEALRNYFQTIRDTYLESDSKETHILGEMCLGSPIPRFIDIEAIYKACPDFKTIHLLRSPLESFPSFASRYEMDSDPVKIAGSWLSQNAHVRKFFEENPQFENQYLMIRYEDLMNDAKTELIKACEFSGIEFEDSMVENLEERWGKNTKVEVPERIQNSIKEVASVDLIRYGYIQN